MLFFLASCYDINQYYRLFFNILFNLVYYFI